MFSFYSIYNEIAVIPVFLAITGTSKTKIVNENTKRIEVNNDVFPTTLNPHLAKLLKGFAEPFTSLATKD